jgi:hypothetical protein
MFLCFIRFSRYVSAKHGNESNQPISPQIQVQCSAHFKFETLPKQLTFQCINKLSSCNHLLIKTKKQVFKFSAPTALFFKLVIWSMKSWWRMMAIAIFQNKNCDFSNLIALVPKLHSASDSPSCRPSAEPNFELWSSVLREKIGFTATRFGSFVSQWIRFEESSCLDASAGN